MLLTPLVAWLTFSGVAIFLTWLGSFVWKKMKKEFPARGGLIGFVVGLTFLLYMTIGASHLYVIVGDNELDHYYVYGEATWTTGDGVDFTVQDSWGECVVINMTARKMACEEVVYGSFFDDGAFYIVEPGELQVVPCRKFDYIFEDAPWEISVSEGTDEVSKWVLRYYRE